MQCAMNWHLAQLTSFFVGRTTCFMRDMLDAIVEPVLMKWDASKNGQKKKKLATKTW